MSIQKLERVLWRVRREEPKNKHPYRLTFQKAIMKECGTSPATFKNNMKALKVLGWIKPYNTIRFTLTDKDLNES